MKGDNLMVEVRYHGSPTCDRIPQQGSLNLNASLFWTLQWRLETFPILQIVFFPSVTFLVRLRRTARFTSQHNEKRTDCMRHHTFTITRNNVVTSLFVTMFDTAEGTGAGCDHVRTQSSFKRPEFVILHGCRCIWCLTVDVLIFNS